MIRVVALVVCFAAAQAGEVRRARKVGRAMAKPIRAEGRAAAGYPVGTGFKYLGMATYYGVRTAFVLTHPFSIF